MLKYWLKSLYITSHMYVQERLAYQQNNNNDDEFFVPINLFTNLWVDFLLPNWWKLYTFFEKKRDSFKREQQFRFLFLSYCNHSSNIFVFKVHEGNIDRERNIYTQTDTAHFSFIFFETCSLSHHSQLDQLFTFPVQLKCIAKTDKLLPTQKRE